MPGVKRHRATRFHLALPLLTTAADGRMCTALLPCTYPHAHTQLAPFMQQQAPAASIMEVLSPAWWLLDGKPLAQFPLGGFLAAAARYVRTNGAVPIACVGALCSLVLLSLLVFVTW
jgi:hypothetical protein